MTVEQESNRIESNQIKSSESNRANERMGGSERGGRCARGRVSTMVGTHASRPHKDKAWHGMARHDET
jgi:hypothetical protein